MKQRNIAFLTVGLLLLGMAGLIIADTRSRSGNLNRLAAQLPESDAVVVFDSRRFFDEAMPRLLAANQPVLAKVGAKLDEVQRQTGIDLRKFDSVAAGAKFIEVQGKDMEFDAVILAQGSVSKETIQNVVKTASKGAYREENISGRTVFIMSPKDLAEKHGAKPIKKDGHSMRFASGDVAVAILDPSTIAAGSLERVKMVIEGKSKLSSDISGFLMSRERSIMSFAARATEGMSKLLPLQNDLLGEDIDSIRYVSGSFDTVDGKLTVQMSARTLKPEQADRLSKTVSGLRDLGKNLLGSSKRADQQAIAKVLENTRITRIANDVTLDVILAQGDIDALIAMVK